MLLKCSISIAIDKLLQGGFYQQYLMMTNKLYKPAPTPPITYTKSDCFPTIKIYILILSWVGAGLVGWGRV
ncbi:MAG: hypothetical protein EAZ78_07265 [Oscillatoriales cyanobacterium]|nr:MAG: hypothetical protein EA000_13270 [Oscillatoriales cyanobacterium]TAD97152.1 MAG: hypothetical protein EAZ98_10560 [Oscillatoriales cyanobacterium]TAF04936.1 MAG: hypothetical protein EAZ78_07265 [Oscillatoriales cyanobacterium]TAF46882.1 MAG: hypothetical protein EAZ68_02980 [Oscillatoriales cyanobacterium]TAF64898.1 MAG: hypothetical protein EAZ59_17435 [Oscillatoriales cyanobacterium]